MTIIYHLNWDTFENERDIINYSETIGKLRCKVVLPPGPNWSLVAVFEYDWACVNLRNSLDLLGFAIWIHGCI